MRSLREYVEELRSLDQHNIGSWPTWAYGLAIALVSATIIGVGTWYFVLPRQEALEQVARKEPELKRTFESKQRLVANLDAYRSQLEAMELQFGALLQQLPSRTEVPSLLNDISQTRIASGLKEDLFKPRAENPRFLCGAAQRSDRDRQLPRTRTFRVRRSRAVAHRHYREYRDCADKRQR